MNRWNQGRTTIDSLIAEGRLERVPASRQAAADQLGRARKRTTTALSVLSSDPDAAYVLAYDAARRALVALLQVQGLRSTSRGGHLALYDAVRAQLDPPLGQKLRPFNRIRSRRNEIESGQAGAPEVTYEEVEADLVRVEELISLAEELCDRLPAY
ncbi:MAG: hypothetical protein LBG60_09410 [Bifidobacteriaceae bacterium]|jgi:hypothetical protein|nr:hypothetical protein [Bifidobacteriaceae bacterium]